MINHNYRPFNTKERNANEVSCIKITKEHVTITNPAGTGEEYNFGFDYIYNVDCKQDDVLNDSPLPVTIKDIEVEPVNGNSVANKLAVINDAEGISQNVPLTDELALTNVVAF